jgi:hypothetical protein
VAGGGTPAALLRHCRCGRGHARGAPAARLLPVRAALSALVMGDQALPGCP